jgi:hypothetical protein
MYGFDELLFVAVHDFGQVIVISTNTKIAKYQVLKSGLLYYSFGVECYERISKS